MKDRNHILITTGIFPPETGGPATLAPILAEGLVEQGYDVTLLTYSTYSDLPTIESDDVYPFEVVRVVRRNKLSNYWRFFKEVRDRISGVDFTYSFDWFSAGVPLSLAARLKRKPYIVRVGGDYGWERYLDWGKEPMTIREFYKKGLYKKGLIYIFYILIRWVLSGAKKVVFNSDVQRGLYKTYYGLGDEKTLTISNPTPVVDVSQERGLEKEILFAGRLEIKNNVSLLIDAFAHAELPEFRLTIVGDGLQKDALKRQVHECGLEERVKFIPRMERNKLLAYMQHVYLIVLPSWTDVSPNTAYEALSLGIPFVITKENYLPFRDNLTMMFDPHSHNELANILERLSDDATYHRYKQEISNIDFNYTVNSFVEKHLLLFNSFLS